MSRAKYLRSWFRDNPDKRRIYNRRYYQKNRAKILADTRARRNGETERARTRAWREKVGPEYWREYRRRKKLKLALSKFTRACAESRARRADERV